MPPKKEKGQGNSMQPESESDVFRETETATHDSRDESADQAATKKKKLPVNGLPTTPFSMK